MEQLLQLCAISVAQPSLVRVMSYLHTSGFLKFIHLRVTPQFKLTLLLHKKEKSTYILA